MKGVILAGGKGMRLRPLTCNVPKPMVPLLHKPVMEYSIELLKEYGITDIAITAGYLNEYIENYFGNGEKWGVSITYFVETSPLGTAGGLKNAELFLDEPFIIMSGDAITDFDLAKGIKFHKEKGSLFSVFMKQVTNPLDYGVILTDHNDKVYRFIEKPSWNEVFSDYVNTGIYIADPEVLAYIPKNHPFDISCDLFPRLLNGDKGLFGYKTTGYWSDIGNLHQYQQTHFDILDKKLSLFPTGNEISPNVWIGKNVKIANGVTIQPPIYIGDYAIIGNGVFLNGYSIIGSRSFISNDARIEQSIIWEDVFIGNSCKLTSATIGSNAQIESGSILSRQTIIGDSCHIKNNTVIKPNSKVWPNNTIEKDSVITSSVNLNSEIGRGLFRERGISGIPNVEITTLFAAKLGLAYGETVNTACSIMIGSDHHPYSELITNTIILSVQSMGVSVVDCGKTIAPVLRKITAISDVKGGIFIFITNETKMTIDLYDSSGIPITSRQKRNLESALQQDNFRQASIDCIGTKVNDNNSTSHYTNQLIEKINSELVNLNKLKIIVSASDYIQSLLQHVSKNRNIEFIFLNDETPIDEISSYVTLSSADFGIIIDSNGEEIIVIDETGRKLNEDNLLALSVIVSLWNHYGKSITVPYFASTELDLVAANLNGFIIRTRNIMRDRIALTGDTFHFQYDAIYAFLLICEIISCKQTTISTLLELVPVSNLIKHHVACPRSAKGRVIRKLIEETNESVVNLEDGIKVYHSDGGWTLILADIDEPMFNVYSQGPNSKSAKDFTNYYIEKIQQYQNST